MLADEPQAATLPSKTVPPPAAFQPPPSQAPPATYNQPPAAQPPQATYNHPPPTQNPGPLVGGSLPPPYNGPPAHPNPHLPPPSNPHLPYVRVDTSTLEYNGWYVLSLPSPLAPSKVSSLPLCLVRVPNPLPWICPLSPTPLCRGPTAGDLGEEVTWILMTSLADLKS